MDRRLEALRSGAVSPAASEGVNRAVQRIKSEYVFAQTVIGTLELLGSQIVHANVMNRDYMGRVGVACVRFSNALETALGLTREVILVFSPYHDLQFRTVQGLDLLRQTLPTVPTQHVVMICSPDPRLAEKLDDWSTNDLLLIPIESPSQVTKSSALELFGVLKRRIYLRNTYDVTAPVERDAFFGRRLLLHEIVDSMASQRPVGLLGLRKAGKTSLLKQMGNLVEQRHNGIFVLRDLEVLPPPGPHLVRSLVNDLIDDIANELNKAGLSDTPVSALAAAQGGEVDVAVFRRALKRTLSIPQLRGRMLVLALDEIEYLCPVEILDDDAGHNQQISQLLGALRSLVQELDNFVFVLAGLTPHLLERGMLFGRHNPLFSWARVHYVRPFDVRDAAELIEGLGRRMGVAWDPGAIARLYRATGGHAFFMRSLAGRVVDSIDIDSPTRTVREESVVGALREWRIEVRPNVQELLGHLGRYYPAEYRLLVRLMEHASKGGYASDKLLSSQMFATLQRLGLAFSSSGRARVPEYLG